MSSRITMSYEVLDQAAAQISTESGEMNGTLQDLRTQLDGMAWEGSDKISYEEAKVQWDEAFTKIDDILQAVGRAVTNAMERYQMTEQANAKRFG